MTVTLALSAFREKDLGEAELLSSDDRASNNRSTSACSSATNCEDTLGPGRLPLLPIWPYRRQESLQEKGPRQRETSKVITTESKRWSLYGQANKRRRSCERRLQRSRGRSSCFDAVELIVNINKYENPVLIPVISENCPQLPV